MSISIKLLDSAKVIEQRINALLSKELNTLLTANRSKFDSRANDFV